MNETDEREDDFSAGVAADLIALPEPGTRKRRAKQAGDDLPRRTRRTSKTRTQSEIKGGLVLANTMFVQLAGDTGRMYGLAEGEIDALTAALYAEIEAHPEWAVWFERVGKLSPHILLAQVLLAIAVPRIAHAMGNTPPEQDSADGNDQREYGNPQSADAWQRENSYGGAPADSVPMETGRAYDDHRGYRNGQIDSSGAYTERADGVPSPTLQT